MDRYYLASCGTCEGKLSKEDRPYHRSHWRTRRHQRWLAIFKGELYVSSHAKAWIDKQDRLRNRLRTRSWYGLSLLQERILYLLLGMDEPVYRTVEEAARIMCMSSGTVARIKREAVETLMAETPSTKKVVAGHD